MFEQQLMRLFYRRAEKPEDLPWHCEEPPALLLAAAKASVVEPKTALDIGCGAGVFSAVLARLGFRVTAVDISKKALEFARRRAGAGASAIDWVEQDILGWENSAQYGLVLDSGTLHNLTGKAVYRYVDKLKFWLAPQGDYILGHWGKRHALDWRPVGPRRRSRATLCHLVAPALQVLAYKASLIENVPLPLGPSVQGQEFWFKRVC